MRTKLAVSNTHKVPTGDGRISGSRRDPFVSRTATAPPTGIQVSAESDRSNTVSPNYKSPNFGNPHLVQSWKGKV